MVKLPTELISPKEYIYCSFFSFSNHLQLLGDRKKQALSTKQSLVLAAIALFDDYVLSLKDIASLVGTSSQNVKKIVVILEKKGFAHIKRDERDARSLRIALTDKGKAYYKEKATESKQALETIFQGFDDERIQRLYSDLRDLMDNILKEVGKENYGDILE